MLFLSTTTILVFLSLMTNDNFLHINIATISKNAKLISLMMLAGNLDLVSTNDVDLLPSNYIPNQTIKSTTSACIQGGSGISTSMHNVAIQSSVRSERAISPWDNFTDVVDSKTCPTLPEMTERGPILVRHVAWRTKSGIKSDPLLELVKVFSAILRLDL
ncbi:putative polyketide hydroxylase [Salvia divinorum]|uniref:Polyketide hydroxylase n=1 Tax=Salvia divinorum TaxID=28513 RepID=A0ABD1H5H9_SALDI